MSTNVKLMDRQAREAWIRNNGLFFSHQMRTDITPTPTQQPLPLAIGHPAPLPPPQLFEPRPIMLKKLGSKSRQESRYVSRQVKPSNSPYQATDRSLGALERIPLELRQLIYEIVLDANEPISLRIDKDRPIRKRTRRNRRKVPLSSRLALLLVSKAVNIEASWVLHTKMVLYLEVNKLFKQYDAAANTLNTKPLWNAASQFRVVHLKLPAIKKAMLLAPRTELLLATIEHLMSYYNGEDSESAIGRRREVMIHLARLFDMKTTSHRTSSTESRLTSGAVEICKKNLKKVVQLVGNNMGRVRWTFSAMTELSDSRSKRVGRKMLKKLKRRLREIGVSFKGLTKEEVPVEQPVVESVGAWGGTHHRFLD